MWNAQEDCVVMSNKKRRLRHPKWCFPQPSHAGPRPGNTAQNTFILPTIYALLDFRVNPTDCEIYERCSLDRPSQFPTMNQRVHDPSFA
jgi:hypothetical protein